MAKTLTFLGFTAKDNTNINALENISVVLALKNDFLVKRIPDVAIPTFIVLSGSIVIFYVSVGDVLKLYGVLDKKPSSRPFVISSRFIKPKIVFKEGRSILGICTSKEQISYEILGHKGEKLYEILTSGDGLHCKIIDESNEQEVAVMHWEPYYTEADTSVINPNDLPPSASYLLKFCVENLDPERKSLILISSFCVQYSQRPIHRKKCTKKSALIITSLMIILLTGFAVSVLYAVYPELFAKIPSFINSFF